jgi:hypothetical protein
VVLFGGACISKPSQLRAAYRAVYLGSVKRRNASNGDVVLVAAEVADRVKALYRHFHHSIGGSVSDGALPLRDDVDQGALAGWGNRLQFSNLRICLGAVSRPGQLCRPPKSPSGGRLVLTQLPYSAMRPAPNRPRQ